MPLTERQEQIKADFLAIHGEWNDGWQAVLELDPEFLAATVGFMAVPYRKRHLEPKVREFVRLVVDANITHLHPGAARRHIAAALAAGATPAEIVEVLECSATVAIHAMNVGVPVLTEVLAERGIRTEPAPLDAYQERLKAEFTANRGYWNPTWDELLELDPEVFEAYTEFSSHPWKHGTLSPKVKEFLYIAFDTSATHIYKVGLKLHIENALDYGATQQEILEVMELAATIGAQSVELGGGILRELLAEG